MADFPQVLRSGEAFRSVNTNWLDFDKLIERLKALYSHWGNNRVELWGSSDALVIATPTPSRNLGYLKSSAFSIWLLGYDFPDTVMLFTKTQLHVFCSPKNSCLLQLLIKAAKWGVSVQVVIHVRNKNKDDDDDDDVSLIMNSIIRDPSSMVNVVGYISTEAAEGNKILKTCSGSLGNEGFKSGDIAAGLGDLMAVMDNEEILCVKRAAYLSANVMTNVVSSNLQNVIDRHEGKKKLDLSAIVDATEMAIFRPTEAGVKLKSRNVEFCYPPDFQSYCSGGVITCSIGTRYKDFCSNVARSFLIDPTPFQAKAYGVLAKAQEAAILALKPGNKMSAAYAAACSSVKSEGCEFVKH